jgi:hypothetical protein
VISPRKIDDEWYYNEPWRDIEWDLQTEGALGYPSDDCPHTWALCLINLGWCLRDAGMAAACEQRGYNTGFAVGHGIGHSAGCAQERREWEEAQGGP